MKYLKFALYLLFTVLLFNACQKEYSIEVPNGIPPIGTWQFNDSTVLYSGNMDSAYIDSSNNTKVLHLVGISKDGTQNFQLLLYGNSFTTGTYKASLFQTSFLYSSGGSALFQAEQLIGEFIVNITTLSSSTIAGTFSGSATNSSNQVVQLTLGKFSSSFGQNSNGAVSTGVLGDSSGNCKPVTLSGLYTKGIALDSSNSVQVEVTVATPGTFSISTNTVNGVTFSNTGIFTATGVQIVTLIGNGTPLNSGSQNFVMKYGNSQCSFSVNFGVPATGTTGGAEGSCTPISVFGSYQQSVPLNALNTIQIQLNVTTPGNYSIVTNSVDGISFSGSGTLPLAGIQTITLKGSGTPVNSGAQNFIVTFGTSSCTFSLIVLPGQTPAGDYFPLTMNSNWTFFLEGGLAGDSVHTQVISYTPNFGSNNYSTITASQVPSAEPFDSFYYRKPGGDYYEFVNFSKIIPFDQSVSGEFIFLKDNVPSGTTWNSPNINGTVGGIPVSGYITMTILAKAVPVTLGSFNFPDVIKMQYQYYITGTPTPIETDQRWFGRNVGEIYNTSSNSGSTSTYDVAEYQVF